MANSNAAARDFSGPALVIEDDALIAFAISDMLELMGFAPIEIARTLQDAMGKIGATTFAIAIVDIKLEGADTFDVARRLKLSGAPFIFASGYSVNLPADLAGVPFASKPFNDEMLMAAIRGVLPSRGPQL